MDADALYGQADNIDSMDAHLTNAFSFNEDIFASFASATASVDPSTLSPLHDAMFLLPQPSVADPSTFTAKQPQQQHQQHPSQATALTTQQVFAINSLGTDVSQTSAQPRKEPHDIDYAAFMSPFLMGDSSGFLEPDQLDDDDLLLTPLISPAMTPSADFSKMTITQSNEIFTPLTSPALHPRLNMDGGSSQQPSVVGAKRRDSQGLSSASTSKKAALASPYTIPRKQRPPQPPPLSTNLPANSIKSAVRSAASPSSASGTTPTATTAPNVFKAPASVAPRTDGFPALISPALTPQLLPVTSPAITPITPAQLMQLEKKGDGKIAALPGALISPSLKPILPGGQAGKNVDAAIRLAQKSNYQNILEGETEALGLSYSSNLSSGVEIRKTSHKQAEQRRRDSLKQSFEELKKLLPLQSEKNPSKVFLLKKSYEYICYLKTKEKEAEEEIRNLKAQIEILKKDKTTDAGKTARLVAGAGKKRVLILSPFVKHETPAAMSGTSPRRAINNVTITPPRKESRGLSNMSPSTLQPASPGVSSSFSYTSFANINKSLSNLDAKNMAREVSQEQTHTDNIWQTICVKVLPLFNGEGLKGCIEDLNDLVSHWLQDNQPQKVTDEVNELLAAGMLTLGNKLNNVPEEQMIGRLVELWSFFFGTVLQYLRGVFLPIREVQTLALMSFRDNLMMPLRGRLEDALPKLAEMDSGRRAQDIPQRLMQMLLVINSVSNSNPQQKAIITDLLQKASVAFAPNV
ncbi:hypothetical protein HK102_013762 [Quaeritorhiza haematococci]|nr:hypothetical protein HK102_013762 [Quaeritorhiza haematococci]